MILSPEMEAQGRARRRWVMARLFELTEEQVARIRPLFPKERGERVDDRKVLSGIIHVIQKGLCWVGAPAPMAPTKPSTTVAAAGETRVFLI